MVTRRNLMKGAAAVTLSAPVLLPSQALAARPEIYMNSWSGLAIGGYDPVAYFTLGDYAEGSAEFEEVWKGAPWRFASAGHRGF